MLKKCLGNYSQNLCRMIADNCVRINIDHYQKIICFEKRPHYN